MKEQLNPLYSGLNDLLGHIREYFRDNGETIYKIRNEIKDIAYGDCKLNVKSFRIPSPFNRIIYSYFRKSKAERSYEYAMRLEKMGVLTPTPVAFKEYYRGGLISDSYYISVSYPYDFTMRDVLEDRTDQKREILEQFAVYCWKVLHRNGVFHLDLSPGNILIRKVDAVGYEFSLIDLNRMKFCKIDGLKGLQNLRQLHTTAENMSIIAAAFGRVAGLDEKWSVNTLIEMDRKYQAFRSRRQHFKRIIQRILFIKRASN